MERVTRACKYLCPFIEESMSIVLQIDLFSGPQCRGRVYPVLSRLRYKKNHVLLGSVTRKNTGMEFHVQGG